MEYQRVSFLISLPVTIEISQGVIGLAKDLFNADPRDASLEDPLLPMSMDDVEQRFEEFVIPEKTEEQIAEENKRFVEFLGEEIEARCKRDVIYRQDLFYDMFSIIIPIGTEGYRIWWMSASHPFARMLHEQYLFHRSKEHSAIMLVRTRLGELVAYSDILVQECVDNIVQMFLEQGIGIVCEQLTEQPVVMQEVEEPARNGISAPGTGDIHHAVSTGNGTWMEPKKVPEIVQPAQKKTAQSKKGD